VKLQSKLFAAGRMAFAIVGIAATVLFVVGLASDLRAFDRTRGGYEPGFRSRHRGSNRSWRNSKPKKNEPPSNCV
jgi:hypothetical protein